MMGRSDGWMDDVILHDMRVVNIMGITTTLAQQLGERIYRLA